MGSLSRLSKKLDDAQSKQKSLMSIALVDQQSVQSKLTKQSDFKVPNIVQTEYVFEPVVEDDEAAIHPVLGTHAVHNHREIDWDAIKFAQSKEWAEVCQHHYDAIVKLGNAPSTPQLKTGRQASRMAMSKAGSSLGGRQSSIDAPKISLQPLKARKKKKRGHSKIQDSSLEGTVEDSSYLSVAKPPKKDKRKRSSSKHKKHKKSKHGGTDHTAQISIDDQSEITPRRPSARKRSAHPSSSKSRREKDPE